MNLERRASIRLRQLRLYVDNHMHDRYLAPPLAIVVAFLLTQWVPVWQAVLWLAIELVVVATYIAVYRSFLRSNPEPRDEPIWANRIALAHGAHMFMWSSIVVWAATPDDPNSVMFGMLIHVGLISLTTVMGSPHRRLLLTDMSIPALALFIPPLLGATLFNVGLGLLGLFFVILMLQVGLRINANTSEALDLRERNEELIRELKQLATRDPLTGISNRRHFIDTGTSLLEEAEHTAKPLSLLIIDIDHFKPINDEYGHLAGDEVLQAVVSACKLELRDRDLFGRLGGEEFAVILPHTPLPDATAVAERLRTQVGQMTFRVKDRPLPITVSIGVTLRQAGELKLPLLLARADHAMYAAKTAGRNRVITDERTPPLAAGASAAIAAVT